MLRGKDSNEFLKLKFVVYKLWWRVINAQTWLYEKMIYLLETIYIYLLETSNSFMSCKTSNSSFYSSLPSSRDKRGTEIDWKPMKCDIFHNIFLFCTSTVHDQSANICIQGYLRILPWIRNTKSSKIDKFHKCYVLCLKLEYFLKSFKT